MKGFIDDIQDLTDKNDDYRRVIYTGKHLQLVVMSLAAGEEIGEEVHADGDQFFRVEKGKGAVWIDGNCTKISADDAFVIPAGARHNVINTGQKQLSLYTLYSPPQHRDGFVANKKSDAELSNEHFDGKTTERPAV